LAQEIMELLIRTKALFASQPMMLELDVGVGKGLYVLGDIHGQFSDLVRIFNKARETELLQVDLLVRLDGRTCPTSCSSATTSTGENGTSRPFFSYSPLN
jgi:hypothetical protein